MQNIRGLRFIDTTEQKIKMAGQEVTVTIQESPEHDLTLDDQKMVDAQNLAELPLKTNITFNLKAKGMIFEVKPGSSAEDGLELTEIIRKMGKYVDKNDKTLNDLEKFIASQKFRRYRHNKS